MIFRAIAQPGSASVWGAGGHRFKSCWPDHNKINDLADKLLILFSYILLSVRTWSDFAPKIIREKRLINLQKSIKVSSKFFDTVFLFPKSPTITFRFNKTFY